MKKIIVFILVLIGASNNAMAQNLLDYNKDYSIGIHFGAVDQRRDCGFQEVVVSMSIYGLYFDIGGWPAAHESDTNIDVWDDEKSFLFHVGYQLPLSYWLKITPIVGYYNHEVGWTNGYDWYTSSSGIHNRFERDFKLSGFDYGLQTQFQVPIGTVSNLNLCWTYTNNMWYGGIGFGFILHK